MEILALLLWYYNNHTNCSILCRYRRYIAPQIWCWLESWWRVLASVEYVHCNPSLQPSPAPQQSGRTPSYGTPEHLTSFIMQWALAALCKYLLQVPAIKYPPWQQPPALESWGYHHGLMCPEETSGLFEHLSSEQKYDVISIVNVDCWQPWYTVAVMA